MANRFTVVEKWDDKWFRSLPPIQKLLFNYLCDKCNLAGFIEIDEEKIAFDTGIPASEIQGAIKGLGRGLLGANGWVWIKNFLRHQKNLPLNMDNHAHKHILGKFLEQRDTFDLSVIEEKIGAIKGLLSPVGIGKGSGKGKEGDSFTELFNVFWAVYPNKVSKGEAEKAWKQIKPTQDVVSLMTEKLPLLIASDKWKKDGGQYIPNPATWLRAKGWLDATGASLQPDQSKLVITPEQKDKLFTDDGH